MFYKLEQHHNVSKNGACTMDSCLTKNWLKSSAPNGNHNDSNESRDDDHPVRLILAEPSGCVNANRMENAKPTVAASRVIVEEPEDSVGLL